MNALQTISEITTMDSREIARLTGKEHKNVIRDCQNMLIWLYWDDVLNDGSNLSHQSQSGFLMENDARGYISHFILDKEHTLTLVSGYSVKLRKAIIDRWVELEKRQPQKKLTYEETMQHALLLADQRVKQLEAK